MNGTQQRLRAQKSQLLELPHSLPYAALAGGRPEANSVLQGCAAGKWANETPSPLGKVYRGRDTASLGPCKALTGGHHSSKHEVAHELALKRWVRVLNITLFSVCKSNTCLLLF